MDHFLIAGKRSHVFRHPSTYASCFSGLLTPKELEVYTKTSSRYDVNWWIPFHWAYTLLFKSQQEGKIGEGPMMRLHDVSPVYNSGYDLRQGHLSVSVKEAES